MLQKNITPKTCNDLEDLIARKKRGFLSTDDTAWLENHLEICEECQNYAVLLENLHDELSPAAPPTPDPQILEHLTQRLASEKQQKAPLGERVIDTIAALLKYRMPVYRAAFGLGILLMLLVYSGNVQNGSNSMPAQSSGHGAYFLADTTEMQDTLFFDAGDATGRSMKDDSLLSRFLHSVM